MLATLLVTSLLAAQIATVDWATRLSATDYRQRAAAVAELDAASGKDPNLLQSGETQAALIALLETENARVMDNLEQTKATGQSSLTEGYADYYSSVLGLTNRLRGVIPADDTTLRPRLIKALVEGTYNPDSRFAYGLAQEGDRLTPLILEMAGSANEPTRWNALALTAQLFNESAAGSLKTPLSSASSQELRTTARKALRDGAAEVRRFAIDAVVAAKDRESVPILLELARSDPDAKSKHSVRSLAAAAAVKLQEPR
jgi:hypothetical protein